MISGKVWGTTEPILETPFIQIHRICVNPRAKCSMHKHEHKWNLFYVVRGSLDIITRKNDYDLTDTTTLYASMAHSVRPGEFHRFENISEVACVALEVYYLDPLAEDIIRENCGGML